MLSRQLLRNHCLRNEQQKKTSMPNASVSRKVRPGAEMNIFLSSIMRPHVCRLVELLF